MKIVITLDQETVAENGRVAPAGVYEAEYNGLNGIYGYDSSDLDKYDALRLNQRLINRAIDNADENDDHIQTVLSGNGEFKGRTCSVKLYTVR